MTERDIFVAALAIDDPIERDRFVVAQCGENVALRQRLRWMLATYQQAEPFLQQPLGDIGSVWPADLPAPNLGAGFGSQVAAASSSAPNRTDTSNPLFNEGALLGPYRLVRKLGEGGMGQVWLAEQHEPVRRQVAIKVIGPGMDSQSILRRFEAERQALALMEHENIARVLDAGATTFGRPYFVMELVKGTPITKYCDEHQLDVSQRLGIFAEVCRAIQHAHHKGVIHRDIKPGNVLVTESDGRPLVKVIDFGVAKAIHQPLVERSKFTQLGQLVGTLEYMSPEQARLNELDVDTRSDVYSLGVLLYELLTGTTPFERQRLREAAFDEMLRMIREDDPPRPSEKLSTSDTLPSVAANRNVEPARLNRLVRGELDWIVMKSLEKDRERRYDSAAALAEDVDNYLADRSVNASPPTLRYRIGKFVRRNRMALGIAALLLMLVTLGVASLWIERNRTWAAKLEADRERDKTLEEKRRAESNLQLAREALENAYLQIGEQWHPADAESQKVRESFLREALRFYEELSRRNATAQELGLDSATAYYRVARLHEQLKSTEPAHSALLQALRAIESLPDEESNWDRRVLEVETLLALARIDSQTGNIKAARERTLSARERAGEFHRRNPQHLEAALAWAHIERTIAYDEAASGQTDAAAARLHEVVDLLDHWPNPPQERISLLRDRAAANGHWARLLRGQNRQDESAAAQQKSVDLFRQLYVETQLPIYRSAWATALFDWGLTLEARNRKDEAQAIMDQAIEELEASVDQVEQLAESDGETVAVLTRAANLLANRRDYERAAKVYSLATKIADRLVATSENDTTLALTQAEVYSAQANNFMSLKQFDQAIAGQRRAIQILERLREKFPDSPAFVVQLANNLDALGFTQIQAGELNDGLATWSQAEKMLEAVLPASPSSTELPFQLGTLLTRHGDRLIESSQRNEGIAMYKRALAMLRSCLGTGEASAAVFSRVLEPHIQYIALISTNAKEAIATLDEAQKIVDEAKRQYPDNSRIRQQASGILMQRAWLCTHSKNHIAAMEWYTQAIAETESAIRLTAQPPSNLRETLGEQYLSLAWSCKHSGAIPASLDAASHAVNVWNPSAVQRWSALQLIAECAKDLRAAEAGAHPAANDLERAMELGRTLLAESKASEVDTGLAINIAWFMANTTEPEWRDPAAAQTLAQSCLSRKNSLTDDVSLLITLAAAQYRSGQYAECLASLANAVERSPGLPIRGVLLKAMALHQIGNIDEGQKLFEVAKGQVSNNANANDDALFSEAEALISAK